MINITMTNIIMTNITNVCVVTSSSNFNTFCELNVYYSHIIHYFMSLAHSILTVFPTYHFKSIITTINTMITIIVVDFTITIIDNNIIIIIVFDAVIINIDPNIIIIVSIVFNIAVIANAIAITAILSFYQNILCNIYLFS